MQSNPETLSEENERGALDFPSEKPLGGSDIGLLLIVHVLCCGVPLLIFSGISVGALLTWVTDSMLPIAGVMSFAALAVWGRLRFWKRIKRKNCITLQSETLQNL